MTTPHRHERFMRRALELAAEAASRGDVPVGAVVVDPDGTIVGEGQNRREVEADPSAHAEIVALRQAAAKAGQWRLDDHRLYVTLEPCVMCAGALINSRVSWLIYGCDDPKAGAVRSLFALCEDPRLNHRLQVTRGVLKEQSSSMLSDFFAALRQG